MHISVNLRNLETKEKTQIKMAVTKLSILLLKPFLHELIYYILQNHQIDIKGCVNNAFGLD